MKLYVVHDQIANEDVSCFFMQNEATLRRSFLDCLADVKNGKGRKPGFLRDGFSLYEYDHCDPDSDSSVQIKRAAIVLKSETVCDWILQKEIEMLDLLPELRNED